MERRVGRVKGRLLVGLALALLLLALGAGALGALADSSGSLTVSVAPAQQTVMWTSSTFGPFEKSFQASINGVWSGGEMVDTFQYADLRVAYDPVLVQLSSAELGDALSGTCAALENVTIDNVMGVADLRVNAQDCYLEAFDGQIVKLNMAATHPGDSALDLSIQAAFASQYEPITQQVVNDGSVRVFSYLNLQSYCSVDPAATRRWSVRNYNPYPVDFTWDIYGSGQSGSGTVPAAQGSTRGEVQFETVTTGGNTCRIHAYGALNNTKASGGARCPDCGDAPDLYQTTGANGGASHAYTAGLYLGAGVDSDLDGQPSVGAEADDLNGSDDEDGVTLPASFTAGAHTTLTVAAIGDGYLSAWADWNVDGDFADQGEQIFADHALTTGSHDLYFWAPETVTPGNTYLRFRYSAQTGLGFAGASISGEVEDYAIGLQAMPAILNEMTKTIVWPAGPAAPGETVELRTVVTNTGGVVTSNSMLERWDNGLSFVEVRQDGWLLDVTPVVVPYNPDKMQIEWNMAPLQPGAHSVIVLKLQAQQVGQWTSWADCLYNDQYGRQEEVDATAIVAVQQVSLSASPAQQTLAKGESFDVEVRVDSGSRMVRGAQTAMHFNPAVMRVDSVEVGPFFSNWALLHGAELIQFPTNATIDNVNGVVGDKAVALGGGGAGGPSGSGAFLIYHCTALADGVSAVDLTASYLVDDLSHVMPGLLVNDGQVTVETVSMSAMPALQAAPVGETFDIQVRVNTGSLQVRGAQAAMHFNPAVMRVDSVEVGPFFSNWALLHGAELIQFPTNAMIDNVNGVVGDKSVALGGGGAGGPSGSGVFLIYHCTALANGVSAVDLTNAFLVDDQAHVFAGLEVNDGQVSVAAVSMSVSPSAQTVDVNATFTVDVMVDTANFASRGAQFGMTFDPAVLEVVGYTVGGFYTDWAAAHGAFLIEYPEPVFDNEAGTISDLGLALGNGDPGGPSGSGVVARFTFQAKAAGQSALNLTNVLVADESSRVIEAVAVQHGAVQVEQGGEPWDLNGDGIIDINDVVKIGLVWGHTGAPCWIPEDLNCDGVIDINDVVVVGLHWS